MRRFVKDDNASLDYGIDWAVVFPDDPIDTSTWQANENLWEQGAAYMVGDHVRLSGDSIVVLEAVAAGVSGTVEPAQPLLGETVVDGSVTWLRAFHVNYWLNSDTTSTVGVTAGTAWQEYSLINHVVTQGGREDDETLYWLIVPK